MDLNLHLVRYLIAVLDEGHFGRAAARLYVSGPALSQQIRSLERKLGVTLVDRSAHPVAPTDAGRRFLPEDEQPSRLRTGRSRRSRPTDANSAGCCGWVS